MQLRVTPIRSPSPDELPYEIVERKGRGHPDTICDALAEAVSIGLSRYYLEHFGAILHHNVDKALLLGGAAKPAFGGGVVTAPIEIIIAGRATRSCNGVAIPVEALALEHCRAWFAANVRNLDLRDVRIVPRIRETSTDLAALFQRGSGGHIPLANDTSYGVGYAPLDGLERAVLAVERTLSSAQTRLDHPAIGDDVKVMGARSEGATRITVACALVGRHVRDLAEYRALKDRIRALAATAAAEAQDGSVEVEVNAADGDSIESIYLTVTGLSAEAGDDGQVGRGNRVNGLITPYRPMSLEAAAGKNPVTHTGKLYNLVAGRIARDLVDKLAGVAEARCFLLSRIGAPISRPEVADIGLRVADPASIEALEAPAEEIVRAHLTGITQLWREVVAGRCPVC